MIPLFFGNTKIRNQIIFGAPLPGVIVFNFDFLTKYGKQSEKTVITKFRISRPKIFKNKFSFKSPGNFAYCYFDTSVFLLLINYLKCLRKYQNAVNYLINNVQLFFNFRCCVTLGHMELGIMTLGITS